MSARARQARSRANALREHPRVADEARVTAQRARIVVGNVMWKLTYTTNLLSKCSVGGHMRNATKVRMKTLSLLETLLHGDDTHTSKF